MLELSEEDQGIIAELIDNKILQDVRPHRIVSPTR